jgi:hypothetical protein
MSKITVERQGVKITFEYDDADEMHKAISAAADFSGVVENAACHFNGLMFEAVCALEIAEVEGGKSSEVTALVPFKPARSWLSAFWGEAFGLPWNAARKDSG